MNLLGLKIMAIKRRRANASLNGDRTMFWGLTDRLNKLVGGKGYGGPVHPRN